jgi:hypothetical protein
MDETVAGAWRDAMVFALFAVLLASAAWMVGAAAGPFEGDPDYIYLLNGLELLTFRSPTYYDHPGTPVELMAAIVITLAWLVSLLQQGVSNIQDHVLAHPVLYLNWVNAAFVLCNACALGFFMSRLRSASGRLFPAMVGGLSLFLSAPAFLAIHRTTAEPVLLAGGLVVAGILAPLAFEVGTETKRSSMALGAAIGFCLAVKVTAAPLLVMILLLRGKESRMTALASCIVTAIVLTLLVAPHYLEMTLWYVRLFTHRDAYGSGAIGAPGFSQLLADAATLATATPETFICLGLYGAMIVGRFGESRRDPAGAVRVLLFIVIFVCFDLLLVLKQPGARYTIPTVPFLCLGNAIVAHHLFRNARAWSMFAVLALLSVLGLWAGRTRMDHLGEARLANQALLEKAAASGCLVAPYYSVDQVQYNLNFGNGWMKNIYRDRLMRLYPDFISYEVGAGVFRNFAGLMSRQVTLAAFSRQKCVYLVGSPRERFGHFGISQEGVSLVAQSPGGPGEAIAIYALKPGWEKYAAP